MKRLTLEATDENILESIKSNTYYRNSDVEEFVQALDSIEGNMFISLNARWGEGKTFFVRQIEKTLEYLTKKKAESEQPDISLDLEPYFERTSLKDIELNNTYLPIYYNAWQYDNHDDPLMSLVFTIVKKAQVHLDATLNISIGDKVKKLLSALSISTNLGVVQGSVNGENLINAFEAKDILANIKLAEDIHAMVKELINEAIAEKAQRLVIIVDELDRCRPTYAIEMLERIKHYFDDERIIFIAAINKEELIHTISKYYGYGFDSSLYLNKFFDHTMQLPPLSEFAKQKMNSSYNSLQQRLNQTAKTLTEYFNLSLRESIMLFGKISKVSTRYVNDEKAQSLIMSVFIPLLMILDMKDEREKIKFLNGESDILSDVFENVELLRRFAMTFGDKFYQEKYTEDNYKTGVARIKSVYKYVFGKNNSGWYDGNIDIDRDLKQKCIEICNKSL